MLMLDALEKLHDAELLPDSWLGNVYPKFGKSSFRTTPVGYKPTLQLISPSRAHLPAAVDLSTRGREEPEPPGGGTTDCGEGDPSCHQRSRDEGRSYSRII